MTKEHPSSDSAGTPLTGHGGEQAIAAARAHGVKTLFTLSGAHVFPVYDAAVGGAEQAGDHPGDSVAAQRSGPMPMVDVRHEATAVFAAEATARLTRTPGLAVVTAGPGVTNAVSGITSASFNGAPLVVLGGRAPTNRWGSGALQEMDHPPLLEPITKAAFTISDPDATADGMDEAFTLASSPHRGPVFVDVPMDVLFTPGTTTVPTGSPPAVLPHDPDSVARIAQLLAGAERPVLVLGSDVWGGFAEEAAAQFVATTGIPTIANGMGRGVIPPGSPHLVTRARSLAFGHADLVVVVGTPLDFRLGYGTFGGADRAPAAAVVHVVDSPGQIAGHTPLAASASGDLSSIFNELAQAFARQPHHRDWALWQEQLRQTTRKAVAADNELLTSNADPIHPARIYGELLPRLADDAVVIGDGGDFVSFAGKYVEPRRPGHWLDPGPFGCLGTGLGYAMAARIARPSSQVVLLMGDGAAGFSLMDVDTLIRHNLPVVIVVGNNAGWGLEKHPMRFLYGYDVAAELGPTRYDEVVRALGGAGETVRQPDQIGPALDRAFTSGVPYLVNVMTDPDAAYPRSTTGI